MTTSKDKKPKKEKQPLTKLDKKRRRRKVVNTLMGIIVFCMVLGVTAGISSAAIILSKSDVTLNTDDLVSSEVSIIYDSDGNEIARLGSEDRENITYDEIPQCVIDAFVAIEDSRYFEHNGFDLPRFTRAFLEDIAAGNFEQGGSTITMQVIKNTYFAVDTIAEKSINRKVQEIYYAMQISTILSKEDIFVLYVNKINFGGSARGIESAASYYFGKTTSELTLVEGAMLAGIVNAPNAYNPYYYPSACQERTAEVLYQMYNHGYITETEYEMALQVNVIDLLVGVSSTSYGDGETISYQAYLDVVIEELEEVYGIDVYTDAVRVYTGMNRTLQDYLDDVADGDVVTFNNDYLNFATTVVENSTGVVVGICGGRDYSSARRYNYATDSRVTPGSIIKAVLSYPLAFEYLGISTVHYETVEPITLDGSSIVVVEDTGTYYGEVSVQRAFCESFNVTAIKLLRQVRSLVGDATIIQYLKDIGFDESVAENFNEQFAIGGYLCYTSTYQMAGACAMLLNGGVYNTPHTVTRIEYADSTKDPITVSYSSKQVLSEGAAYLTTCLMRMNVEPSLGTTGESWSNNRVTILKKDYPVYAKTGTASLPESMISSMGWPSTGSKDRWLLVATREFSMCAWLGYDYSNGYDENSYISRSDRNLRQDSYVCDDILDILADEYGANYEEIPQPASVVSITSIKGLYPYTSLPDWYDSETGTVSELTGLILSDYASLESWENPSIESPEATDFTLSYDSSTNSINVTTTVYPDEDALTAETTTLEMKYDSKTYSGARAYSSTWVNGVVEYVYELYDSSGTLIDYLTSSSNEATFTLSDTQVEDTTYTVYSYYQYSIAPVQSASVNSTILVLGTGIVEEEETPEVDDTTDTTEDYTVTQ